MVELSPAKEAELAEVTSGAMEHHNSCVLNHRPQFIPLPLALPYLIYLSFIYPMSQMWSRSQLAYNPCNWSRGEKTHSPLFKWWLPPELSGAFPELFCHAEQIHKPLEVASLFWNVCPLFQGNCLLNGDLLNIRTLLSWNWEEHMRRGMLAVFPVMQALTQPGVSLSNPASTFYMMIDNLKLWAEAVRARQQELNPNWPSDTHGETI